ncbi:MAG: hypothetical protein ABUL58_00985 [Steroidobacter sp.]
MRPLPATILSSALLGCLTILVFTHAFADQNAAKRMAQFSKLPNWTGVWEAAASNNAAASNEPAFNTAWLQKQNTRKPGPASSDNAVSRCVWGMPRLLRSPHSFEITVLPEQTFFSYDINEFRHVWTDGRRHPLHAASTNTGHSIGHWEGNTLVIDTVGMQSGLWISHKGGILSPKAVLEERWNQIDNDHLKVDVTVHDSVALSKPFAFTRRYERAEATRLTQKQCFEESHDAADKDSES